MAIGKQPLFKINKMKNFYQWLTAFITLIVIILMTDLNIAWIKQPANKSTMLVIRVSFTLLLVTFIGWNIYKHNRNKSN